MVPPFTYQTHTHDSFYFRRQLAFTIKNKSPKSDIGVASTQEKRNTLLRWIKKWRELQFVYMPGVAVAPFGISEDDAEDDIEAAKDIPLLLPSGLDTETRERICLDQVAEHERLLRIVQLQDSLVELRNTRKIRRGLLVNHHTQIAGQGQRANTRLRAILTNIESRITRSVERYRSGYQALLWLDPAGDWRDTYLQLKDSDN